MLDPTTVESAKPDLDHDYISGTISLFFSIRPERTLLFLSIH